MTRTPYSKPHISSTEIIEHLQSRGLVVPDLASAAEKIDIMGYTHLRMYLESRCDTNKPNRPFVNSITFPEILRIYECDSKLRTICFDSVGHFELIFRNTISETLSEQFGSHPQYEVAAFKSQEKQKNILNMFRDIYSKQKRRDGLAKEYDLKFSSPDLPPIWYMKEMLTFGDSAELLKSLNKKIELKIAKKFGWPSQHGFRNWIYALIDLRNLCAHHDRLFNRTFQKSLIVLRLKAGTVPSADARIDKLASLLKCLDYVMTARGIPQNIEAAVLDVLLNYSEVEHPEIGYL